MGEGAAPEDLADAAGVPVDRVLAALLELELGGWVTRRPGPRFARA
jgi:predicted Rossmann fold nucleotide-binding protein DprA/Smf involved in DNA uptake